MAPINTTACKKTDIILSQFIVHVSVTFASHHIATLSAMKAIEENFNAPIAHVRTITFT